MPHDPAAWYIDEFRSAPVAGPLDEGRRFQFVTVGFFRGAAVAAFDFIDFLNETYEVSG